MVVVGLEERCCTGFCNLCRQEDRNGPSGSVAAADAFACKGAATLNVFYRGRWPGLPTIVALNEVRCQV